MRLDKALFMAVALPIFGGVASAGAVAETLHESAAQDDSGGVLCLGDFDGDRTVSLADFLAFVGAFGTRSGDGNYNALMDLDGNGAVDLSDFLAFAGVFGTTCEAPPPRTEDHETLVALYNATDGPNWRFNTNWLSDRPLGDWYGVTTDAAGRVTELGLYAIATSDGDTVRIGEGDGKDVGNRLTGSIPSELGRLTNLQRLDLSGNQLMGTIPSELGNLANLIELDLGFNDLAGPTPAALGNLTNLEELFLSHNQLIGCIPASLRDVSSNDFEVLGLTFCECEELDTAYLHSAARHTSTWIREFFPERFARLSQQPWFADGLDDEDAALVYLLSHFSGYPKEFDDLIQARRYVLEQYAFSTRERCSCR